MFRKNDDLPYVERRSVDRVSSAAWPASIRQVVATGRAAQRHRDRLMQRRRLALLSNVLAMRVTFVLTMLLVVASSLLVAVLGLRFWYLLLLPLLFFSPMTLLFLLIAQKRRTKVPLLDLPAFIHESRSSTGFLTPVSRLRSSAGYLHGSPGHLASLAASTATPATPVPAEAPLVRVLETYDLREAQAMRFFAGDPRNETGEHAPVQRSLHNDFWDAAACPTTLDSPTDSLAAEPAPRSHVADNPPDQQPQP